MSATQCTANRGLCWGEMRRYPWPSTHRKDHFVRCVVELRTADMPTTRRVAEMDRAVIDHFDMYWERRLVIKPAMTGLHLALYPFSGGRSSTKFFQ